MAVAVFGVGLGCVYHAHALASKDKIDVEEMQAAALAETGDEEYAGVGR